MLIFILKYGKYIDTVVFWKKMWVAFALLLTILQQKYQCIWEIT